jgi:hypothetical protein
VTVDDDRSEIANLIARYAELLNLGRIDEVGALFRYGRVTSEGNPNVYEGTDGVVAMYRESVVLGEKVPDTLIFTSNLQIEVHGDTATGRAYFLVMHESSAGVAPVLAGRYHDEFRRIDGTWWFHHRHMLPDLRGDLSSHLTKSIDEFSGPSGTGGE